MTEATIQFLSNSLVPINNIMHAC